jgi:hypothetical protein
VNVKSQGNSKDYIPRREKALLIKKEMTAQLKSREKQKGNAEKSRKQLATLTMDLK